MQTRDQFDQVMERLDDIVVRECGKKYDFSVIWALLKNRLLGIRIDPSDDTRPICSELVNQSYHYTLDDRGDCTPVTLANRLMQGNG